MVSPQKVGTALVLLGVVPTAGYALWSPEVASYLAVVNTVLIALSVYLMLSPTDESVATPT